MPGKDKDKIHYEDLYITADMDDIEIENVIRRRIEWRQRKRRQLMGHIPVYLLANGITWGIFVAMARNGFAFPWPVFMTFFWGAGIVKDAWELYQSYTDAPNRREEYMQREIEREKMRLGIYEKPKRDYAEKSKNRPLRVGSDGEIVPLDQLLEDEEQDETQYYQHNRR